MMDKLKLLFIISLLFCRSEVFAERDYPFESKESRLVGLCDQRFNEYTNLKKDLSSKCGGTTKSNCIAQATECNAQGGEESGSSGLGALGSILGGVMPSLGGGMGHPMLGGAGAESFKCLPKSTRDQIKKDYEKLREEAKKGKDEAEKYKREIDKDADELTEQIGDLKKTYHDELLKAQKADIQLEAEITAARDKAEQEAMQLLSALDKMEQEKVLVMGQKEEAQARLGTLYVDSIQPCVDKMTADTQEFKGNTFFKFKQQLQASIDAATDLREKERIRRKGEATLKQDEALFRSALKASYDACLRAATTDYKTKYNQLTTAIKQLEKDLVSKNNAVEMAQKRLARIPEVLDQAIQGLKKNLQAEKQNVLTLLQQNQQQIQSLVSNYQRRFQEAQASYAQATQQLNSAQLNYQSNQQAFQMNTFGDAAPIVEDIAEARRLACDVCKLSVSSIVTKNLCSDPDDYNSRDGNL